MVHSLVPRLSLLRAHNIRVTFDPHTKKPDRLLDVPYDPTRLWSLLFHNHTMLLLLLPLTLHYCRTPTTRATGAAYSIPH